MQLESWTLRDPASALHAIHTHTPLAPGRVAMALFERPPTLQRLVDVVVLSDREPPPDDFERLRNHVKDAAHVLFRGRKGPWPPTYAFVIVVARHGRVIFRDDDWIWSAGLLYANHLEPAFNGELILVTEHGFRCFDDATVGRHPALLAA